MWWNHTSNFESTEECKTSQSLYNLSTKLRKETRSDITINLNIDDVPISPRVHVTLVSHYPSHSQTSHLLSVSLSLKNWNLLLPLHLVCVRLRHPPVRFNVPHQTDTFSRLSPLSLGLSVVLIKNNPLSNGRPAQTARGGPGDPLHRLKPEPVRLKNLPVDCIVVWC